MKKIRIQDIKAEDLIGRNFTKPDLSKLELDMQAKTVLVTGAGGSIGSELSRQIATMHIKRLILAEHSEFALYNIYEELSETYSDSDIEIIPYLINICNMNSLEFLFDKFTPSFIYHAAAYKHVNIVEVNPFSGIINNILSTQNLLEVSVKYNVNKFVLISTDKAVRSTNVMGATKRICELLTTATANATGLSFSSVRFGNVAGSSGSLIPKLKKQVASNKALTITDQKMERFFMLIPEAVNLVLKSSESAMPADITLLNMGKSIKIMDLAEKLLSLSGRDPKTYPIKYTGAKPGEKMAEELIIKDGISFEQDQMFIRLKDGDDSFKQLNYKNEYFSNIFKVSEKIISLAKGYNSESIELLKATANSTATTNNIIEVDFSKKSKAA